MKTSLPTALIYGWDRFGEIRIQSDIYWEENLYENVILYSYETSTNFKLQFATHRPDIIILIGDGFDEVYELSNHIIIKSKILNYDVIPPDNILANDVVCQSTFWACKSQKEVYANDQTPILSVFTPTYKTGERIKRTYDSLAKQTFTNWEWVVVDDSPDNQTWNILNEIAKNDYRVKLHRILPLSGGNVGLAKHRAATLGSGDWLVELDHDDALTTECLEISNDAILKYPDAGFLYSDVCEMYEDGEMKTYDHDWSGNWYARHDNYFDFGYAGHTWVNVDKKDILAHWYPDINPLSIRFNISMPDHVRMWDRNLYNQIGGHNKNTPVADDLEILIRTFLNTRMIHVKKVLYFQYNNRNSTVDNNATDINRRARLIRDYYDLAIHNRIQELGFHDWNWDDELGHSQKFQNKVPIRKYYDEEQVMNYIYE